MTGPSRLLGRRDRNEREIINALRAHGASVSQLDWWCDLAVGFQNQNYFLEVKDGAKSPSKRQLTPFEKHFHETWRGQITIVKNVDEALEACGIPPTAQQSAQGTQN